MIRYGEGDAMDILTVLEQVRALLQKQGHISYRILKLQFQLDEEHIEALKEELIEIEELAVDQGNKMLVWMGDDSQTRNQRPSAAATPVPRQTQPKKRTRSKAAQPPESRRKT